MERSQLEYLRAERLIATGRLVLVIFALVVAYVDPDVRHMRLLSGVGFLLFFAVYSAVLAVLTWRVPTVVAELRLGIHIADFLLFAVLIQLTHASVSPFFVLFLFSVLSGFLRFGVRGLLWTAGAAIAAYVALAAADESLRSQPGYLIMRVTTVAVTTLLLAYVGLYQERMRLELRKLAAWPRTMAEQREPFIRDTLTLARESLEVPRVLLVWDDEEEPWMWFALLEVDALQIEKHPPDVLDVMLAPNVRGETFVSGPEGARIITHDEGRLISRAAGPAFSPAAVENYSLRHVLSVEVIGDTVSGRLFFLDRELEAHEGAVAEVVARLVATRLDQLNAAKRNRLAAVSEERLRVARDLHDGLLQSLTGAALQLQTALQLIVTDPSAARERLRNVQDLIAADQRELRSFIAQLRPKDGALRPSLQTRLLELADRFQRQWDMAVTIDVDIELAELRGDLASDVSSIVTEAISNAAKHARAGRVDAAVRRRDGTVEITISDDGTGFPFLGSYTLAELDEQRRGPVTLKERVASLRGDLRLTSTTSGSRIEVTLDLGEGTV